VFPGATGKMAYIFISDEYDEDEYIDGTSDTLISRILF
jgi:hypothetical protein